MGQPPPPETKPEEQAQELPVLSRNHGDWSFPDGPQQAEGEPYPYAVFAYYHPGRASEIPADRLDEAMIGAQALAQNQYGQQAQQALSHQLTRIEALPPTPRRGCGRKSGSTSRTRRVCGRRPSRWMRRTPPSRRPSAGRRSGRDASSARRSRPPQGRPAPPPPRLAG